ncbi:MAG: tetratricopeptide repeat protein [Planctomycetes bacterium]|nr:tetratricopeptide repeat protein [Planctomycetota bacterium]
MLSRLFHRALLFAALTGGLLASAGCSLFIDPVDEARFKYVESPIAGPALEARMAEADQLYLEPRSPAKVRQSLSVAAQSISRANGYAALWRAARACAWLADSELDEEERHRYAFEGVAISKEAARLAPQLPESHFYYALNLGLLSQIEGKGLNRIPVLERLAKKVVELDEKFEHAGGHRFLGLLYLETKDYPFAAIGDLEDAFRHLKRACELAPDYGHNQLALAQAYYEDGEYEKAAERLKLVLASPAPPDESEDHRKWVEKAKELLEEIK